MMKIVYILTSLTLFSLTSGFAQSESQVINSMASDAHVSFKSSDHQIRVPSGFIQHTGNGINGFINEEGSAEIVIVEMAVPMTMCQQKLGMSLSNSADFEVTEQINFEMNGYDALLIAGIHQIGDEQKTRFVLFSGDSQKSVMINVTAPINSNIKESLRESLLSTVLNF